MPTDCPPTAKRLLGYRPGSGNEPAIRSCTPKRGIVFRVVAGPNLVGAFRSPLGVGSRLYYYDIDAGRQLETQTSEGDFFFKPDDPRNPESRIGLEALNGARYAPRFPGLLPWEVEDGNFTSSGGVYSVEQGQDIPCFTSEKRPCTFMIRLEPQGEMFVSFAVYK